MKFTIRFARSLMLLSFSQLKFSYNLEKVSKFCFAFEILFRNLSKNKTKKLLIHFFAIFYTLLPNTFTCSNRLCGVNFCFLESKCFIHITHVLTFMILLLLPFLTNSTLFVFAFIAIPLVANKNNHHYITSMTEL